jgi:hypothetical protein
MGAVGDAVGGRELAAYGRYSLQRPHDQASLPMTAP